MNVQEANEYIQTALIGTIRLDGLEATILRNLTELNQEALKLAQNIQQATAHLEQAKVQLLTLNGRREGYAQLLVDEESARRKATEASKHTMRAKFEKLSHEEKKSLGDVLGSPSPALEVLHAKG